MVPVHKTWYIKDSHNSKKSLHPHSAASVYSTHRSSENKQKTFIEFSKCKSEKYAMIDRAENADFHQTIAENNVEYEKYTRR